MHHTILTTIQSQIVLFSQSVGSETTPIQPTNFTVAPWMIYVGGAILLFLIISFLVSIAKDKRSSF